MRVLLLLPYPLDTVPGQRFRIEQWCPWLRAHGVQFRTLTLLTPADQQLLYSPGHTAAKAVMLVARLARRAAQLRHLRGIDVIWLHRAALPVGPALLERLLAQRGLPVIFEFDDAIYLTDTAAANARWGFLKCSAKTAAICRMSTHVVVGNDHLAQYARRFNPNVTVIPTSIDTAVYPARLRYPEPSPVVIGWSGSRTTLAHLRRLDGVLKQLAVRADIRLHVIGTDAYAVEGVEARAVEWSSRAEVAELQRFDIGVMPLPDEEWARGKCGLKALQYMALGIPTVASPVGVNAQIIRDGANGILAGSDAEWTQNLLALATSVELRERLGRAGRMTVEETYSAEGQAPRVLEVLNDVGARAGRQSVDRAAAAP